jgi:hypothetical protein
VNSLRNAGEFGRRPGNGRRDVEVKALRAIALFLRQAADVSAVFLILQHAGQVIFFAPW